MVRTAFAAFVLVSLVAAASQNPSPPPQTQAQQRPVFRGGTHFVRVDAYPTTKDGKIVDGLTADDFEVSEDGKPQTIESFDFISFPTFTPEAERRDPASQQAAYDAAADPRYRVFVILLDMEYGLPAGTHFDPAAAADPVKDMRSIQQPLTQFLDRVLGPMDLFGFLTTAESAKDLVLGQKTASVETQIAELAHTALMDHDRDLDRFNGCRDAQELKRRYKIDRTYVALESLVDQLGSLRDERKNVIFLANDLSREKSDMSLAGVNGPGFPKIGVTNGRVGIGDHANGQANDQLCMGEAQRLAAADFDDRYRNLLKSAREQNVTFYPITPGGLRAPTTHAGQLAVDRATDNVIALAHETDGVAIVNTNDLSGGMKKIADDLAAYYVLGYYTTNTKWDGGVRTIKVRLKSSGETIRARRQYRAPTQEEIDELAARPAPGTRGTAKPATDRETALAVLERASRPFAAYTALNGKTLTVVAELSPLSIQGARWKDGADVQISASAADGKQVATARGRIDAGASVAVVPLTIDPADPPTRLSVVLSGPGERPADDWLNLPRSTGALVGDPMAYRSASRVAPRPVAAFEFARNERIKIEWPVLAASLDRREVRLLDHAGKPLPVEIPLSEDSARKLLTVDVSLSGLPHGDYLFDLTVGSGGTTEQHLLAVRMK